MGLLAEQEEHTEVKVQKKRETVETEQELHCEGMARFISFEEESEVSSSSLVFCPRPLIWLSTAALKGGTSEPELIWCVNFFKWESKFYNNYRTRNKILILTPCELYQKPFWLSEKHKYFFNIITFHCVKSTHWNIFLEILSDKPTQSNI